MSDVKQESRSKPIVPVPSTPTSGPATFFSTPSTGKRDVKDNKGLGVVINELEQIFQSRLEGVPHSVAVLGFDNSFRYVMKRLRQFNGEKVTFTPAELNSNPENDGNSQNFGSACVTGFLQTSKRLCAFRTEQEKLYDILFKEQYIWGGGARYLSAACPVLKIFTLRLAPCLERLKPFLTTADRGLSCGF